MRKFFYIPLLLLSLSVLSCAVEDKGFEGSDIFVQDFEERAPKIEKADIMQTFERNLSQAQREALQFLYAYMPVSDVADYSPDYFLMNVDYSLKAREEMPWGSKVPDREFLHFVLPIRVNNENMDDSRKVFYEELKERVGSLSMHDAVLEVNHWCHEKVTYTPSDIRTSSPLATVRTAYGRCGEESTFTVAALRAVGIPARQVYTPRWAHTDNNHAWVEAWVDGEWYFLGACEPEPVLNLGWFNAPASRGMLMHTNAFGKYNGPEEVLSTTPCFTEINVTANYAPVATTEILVTDEQGNPVQATVEFKIYNYAEFNTAATKQCSADGRTSITCGLGDMIVWASKEGKFGFEKFTAGKDKEVRIVLDKAPGYKGSLTMDIVPPVERNTVPSLTDEQVNENTRRFAREDSIRNAYVATFPTTQQIDELAQMLGIGTEYVQPLVAESRGNYNTIITFLKSVEKDKQDRALGLLCAISEKDRRDISLDVLNDHFTATPEGKNSSVYANFVLNPRVSNEMLTPYKGFFASVISADERAKFAENPEEWVEWCSKNIKVDSEWNPLELCMSPMGVWKMREADPHSRDIFFVSGARSMGIPARIDEVTGKTQYLNEIPAEGAPYKWIDVNFSKDTGAASLPAGKLFLTYNPTKYIDNPRYYTHYSISKIENGKLLFQSYPYNAGWESLFKKGQTMDVGDYMLMSGTRMANGSVLANIEFLQVSEGEKTKVPLVMRESDSDLSVIGEFNSENIFYDLAEARERSILSATGRGYYVIALIDPNSEPTNHFLRDVMPYTKEFEEWGQKMVLLFNDVSAAARFKGDDFTLPATVVMGTDVDSKITNEIIANMKLKAANRPVILVADTFNRVVFMSQGYSIGLGEQLIKVIKQLSQK